MAFDRNDPVQLAELKDEMNTDPLGIGYDPLGANQPNVDLINAKNYTVDKPKISAAAVRSATTLDAYDGVLADKQEWLRWMTGTNGFDEENMDVTPDLRVQLTGDGGASIWAVGERPEMEAAMLALIETAGSRAEVLWGHGTSISTADWAAARDS